MFQFRCNGFLVFKFNKVDLHFIILQILVPLDNEKYYIFTGVNSWFLTGVTCPRAPLTNPKAGQVFEAEKYGQEALQFTKELVLQREVITTLSFSFYHIL